MKHKTRLPHLFLGVVTVILYLPIVLVVVYSFNESKISSVWSGFSLTWYQTLFRDKDMFQALVNSIVLGLCSSIAPPSSAHWGRFIHALAIAYQKTD